MLLDSLYFQGVKPRRRTRTEAARPSGHGIKIEDDQVDAFFEDLFPRLGLEVKAYRYRALNRRVPACLRFLRVADLEAARAKLKAQPELAAAIASIVLLGVTEFCRDRSVFEEIRAHILPSLARLRRPLCVWSAACSDGRELMSLAILLSEANLLDGADLLGTDCRSDAIRQAEAGVFPVNTVQGLGPEWEKHFTSTGSYVRPADALQRNLRWRQANLLDSTEPGPWDLILWRNMAIYLEPRTAEATWSAIVRELAPGGYLVTGKADYPPRMAPLEKVGACLYRKRFES